MSNRSSWRVAEEADSQFYFAVRLKYLPNPEYLQFEELSKVLANQPLDRRPRWLPPFKHPNLLRSFTKPRRSKNSFSDVPKY